MSTVEKGFIFVLTNSSQPDLVLIGAGTDHPERALREGLLDDAISGQSPTLCYTALVDNLNAATSQVDQTLPSSSFGTGYFEGTTTDAVLAIRNSGAEILYEEASGVDMPPLTAVDTAADEQIQVDASQQLVPVDTSDQELDQYEEDDDLWQQEDIRVNPRPRSWGPVPRGRRQTPVNPYRSNIRDRQARKQDALRKLAAAVDGAEVGGSKPAMIIDDQQPVGLGTGANAFVPNAKAKKRSLDDTRGGLTEAPQHQPPHARTVQQSSARNAKHSEPELISEPEQDDVQPRKSGSTSRTKKKAAIEPQLSPIGDLPEDLSKNSPKNISINAEPDGTQDSLNDISMNWLWKRDNDVNTRRESVRDDDGYDEHVIFDKEFDKDVDKAAATLFDKDSGKGSDSDSEQFVQLENLSPPVAPKLDAERIQSESRLHKAANSPPRKADAAPDPITTDVPVPDTQPPVSSAASAPPVKPKQLSGSKVPLSQRPTPTLEIPLREHDKPIQPPPPPQPPMPAQVASVPAAADGARAEFATAESVSETGPIQQRQTAPEPRRVPPLSPPAPAAEAPTPPPPPLAPASTATPPAPAKPVAAAAPRNERQTLQPPASVQPPSPADVSPPQPPAGRQKNLHNKPQPRRDGGAVVKIPGGKKEVDKNASDGMEKSPVPPPTVPSTRPQKAGQPGKPGTTDSVTARPSRDSGKNSPPPASPRAQHDHLVGSGQQPITPPVAATAPPPNIPLPRVPRPTPEDSFDAPAPATSVPPASSTPAVGPVSSENPVSGANSVPPTSAVPAATPSVVTAPAASPLAPATAAAKPARAAGAKVDPGKIESWVQSQDKTHGRRISNRRATRWSMLGIPLGALAGAAYLVLNPQIEQMSKISIVVGGIVTGIVVCFLLARLLLTNPKY